MNNLIPRLVLPPVRVPLCLFLMSLGLLITSCSPTRTLNVERTLPAGNHVEKTVMRCDFLVKSGSRLEVAYSSESRYFVAKDGVLVGFKKGVKDSRIYAEKGALIPDARRQEGVTVITVKDAEKSYRDRYKELSPSGMRTGSTSGVRIVPVVGVGLGVNRGFWGNGWGGWGRGFGRRRSSSRSVSVRPSFYRKRN